MEIVMDWQKLKKREVVLGLLQIIIALLISLNAAYIFSYRWDVKKKELCNEKVSELVS